MWFGWKANPVRRRSLNSAGKNTPRFVDTWASVDFDTLRWVAALLVLVEHCRNLFFVDYPELVTHRTWMLLFYGVCGSGHQSVILFFVLSGFFIGGTVFRALETKRWTWRDYLLRRLVRLWIVLIPALLLCLLFDRTGLFLGRAPLLYQGLVPNHMLGDTAALLAPHIFFGNLLFLQGILTPVYGTDGALWSLAFEAWYYVLFPLALLAVWPGIRTPKRLLYVGLFAAFAWFVRGGILQSFPIWLAGVALARVRAPSLSVVGGRWGRRVATIIYFAVFLSLGRVHSISGMLSDYLLTALTLVYLWLLLSNKERFRPESVPVRASRETARFSYTLYAAHTPMLVLLASFVVGDGRWTPSAGTVCIGIGFLVASMFFSYGLAWLTEFRTDALRVRLERMLGINDARPLLASNPGAESRGA